MKALQGETASFRRCERRDIPVLLAMTETFYRHECIPVDEERSRTAMNRLMDEPGTGSIWAIETQATIAGYLVLTIGFSLELGGHYGLIDELFIKEPHRGRGLGMAAVQHACDECRTLGIKVLMLEADLQNEGATRLYRRLGFKEHARRLMRLALTNA